MILNMNTFWLVIYLLGLTSEFFSFIKIKTPTGTLFRCMLNQGKTKPFVPTAGKILEKTLSYV